MKKLLTIVTLLLSISAFSQADKKVEKNNEKIEELNKRLDNLLGGSKSISGDSVSVKLDLLFEGIKGIKAEMQSIQNSLEQMKSNGIPTNSNNSQISNLNNKLSDIESGEYYVVIASERDKNRAQLVAKKFQKKAEVKIVRNNKETWYHVVLNEALSMRAAISKTIQVKKNFVSDAWWITGKRLKEI